MPKRVNALLLVLSLILADCASPVTPLPPTDVASPPGPTNTAAPAPTIMPVPTPTSTAAPTQTVPAAPPTPIPADLTPAQQAAMQAVAEKYKLDISQIHVIKTEAMSWPSGCLGIVIPGVLCTQGPVDGFKITLEANGQQYEYHTNQDGTSAIDAAQQLATLHLVVLALDGTVQLVTPNIPLGPTCNPAFNGFLPYGGAVAGIAYVLDFSQQTQVQAIDVNGVRGLSFIKNPTYGLALWRGGPNTAPHLAWGTQLTDNGPSTLQVSALDGSQLETLVTETAGANPPIQLVAEFWSADGQSLYFSKEPVGVGGYILFAGGSNLYRLDVATKNVTELIPQSAGTPSSPLGCLDALSGDYRFVADHCTPNTITIRDLAASNGLTSTIEPPVEAAGFRFMGSARFSPDGKRVAFALGKGDPNDEQGWVAVSDSTSGPSKVILTGPGGLYYTVLGWLDDQTLLLQSSETKCSSICTNHLWTLGLDGSNPVKVADGSFLTIIDNR
jgi:hypothetical protein